MKVWIDHYVLWPYFENEPETTPPTMDPTLSVVEITEEQANRWRAARTAWRQIENEMAEVLLARDLGTTARR